MNRLANPLARRGFALPEKTRQIKVWVRRACGLDDDVVVSVTELACRKNGCPDIETVIGIMRPGEKIETIRVNKAIAEVTSHDLPRG
ncbi:nitrate reductase [Mesorhizobium sp.]|uniref:nitrate reductase n=1 Tax=Mesorhizobium sp. TaxID=1871066 RepID=UPI0025DA495A|nr:nitrate reductase [Mesorhizobium sp.]